LGQHIHPQIIGNKALIGNRRHQNGNDLGETGQNPAQAQCQMARMPHYAKIAGSAQAGLGPNFPTL
jgi:hypothetical protein